MEWRLRNIRGLQKVLLAGILSIFKTERVLQVTEFERAP
jgi:hypothetical protein